MLPLEFAQNMRQLTSCEACAPGAWLLTVRQGPWKRRRAEHTPLDCALQGSRVPAVAQRRRQACCSSGPHSRRPQVWFLVSVPCAVRSAEVGQLGEGRFWECLPKASPLPWAGTGGESCCLSPVQEGREVCPGPCQRPDSLLHPPSFSGVNSSRLNVG